MRVLDDLSTGRPVNLDDVAADVELIHGDVRDQEVVTRAIAGAQLVFHEAAIPSVARSVDDPIASNEVNVAGTLNVLVAARDANVERVVYASSAAVYGNADVLPLHEGMPTRPASPYGVSKLAGERYLEAFTRTWGLPNGRAPLPERVRPASEPRLGLRGGDPPVHLVHARRRGAHRVR